MKQVTEPQMLIPVSNLIRLIEVFRSSTQFRYGEASTEFDWEYSEAVRKLRSYNRKTLSN